MRILLSACLSFVLLLVPHPEVNPQENRFPASISDIQAQFVVINRIPQAVTRSAPEHVASWISSCIFELTIDIELRDSSFWGAVPFDLVGHLPDGSIYQRTITADSLRPTSSGNVQAFNIRIESKKSGPASFILTTYQAPRRLEFFDYPIRSDQRSIYLNCGNNH